ncbi:MAG: hypothetical protein M1358_07460 [Chloroflexi bacterium]|nr:hypothetical protein [Chloroflexota bacterium]
MPREDRVDIRRGHIYFKSVAFDRACLGNCHHNTDVWAQVQMIRWVDTSAGVISFGERFSHNPHSALRLHNGAADERDACSCTFEKGCELLRRNAAGDAVENAL